MLTDTNLILLARLLLGGAFLIFGIRNIPNIDGLTAALTARGLPLPRVAAIIGVTLQIVGGALTAIGPFGAIGGLALIVFVVLATVLFHNFWDYSGPRPGQPSQCDHHECRPDGSLPAAHRRRLVIPPIFKIEWQFG